jgi:hypothetical protein
MCRAVCRPSARSARRFENFRHFRNRVFDNPSVIFVITETDVRNGQTVLVALVGVKFHHIFRLRQNLADISSTQKLERLAKG